MNLNKHLEYFNPANIASNRLAVNVIGVGAVGSYIAIQLAKLGLAEITIWDFDTVNDHNITNQVYTVNDIGVPKVDALEKHLLASNPNMIINKKGKWSPEDVVEGIVFLEVDSMKVRKEFAEANEYNNALHLLIDARIGLETGEVNACDWTNYEQVETYIAKVNSFSDDEASTVVSACGTTLSVSPSVYLSAAMAVATMINYINKHEIKTFIAFNAFEHLMKGLNK